MRGLVLDGDGSATFEGLGGGVSILLSRRFFAGESDMDGLVKGQFGFFFGMGGGDQTYNELMLSRSGLLLACSVFGLAVAFSPSGERRVKLEVTRGKVLSFKGV